MEIAGSTCMVCGQHIVLAREGMCCPSCRNVLHRACDAQSTCRQCGAAYQIPEPPVADVARDAVLPRSLRSGRSTSPVALVVLAALALLFGLAFLVFFLHPHR
jgi:hypothetical protein